ncbi:MAG: [Fe-Fe] hydrogenase large subunit C-terminal domain-containing protein [Eubacteriaceae bacterium]|nr:[Fe-Fe] hydrogenase large subunit C-terminal domain-containing protein [Eubacteriaceae bacterium]
MEKNVQFYHSVYLDGKNCKGCINCIKRCPTKAIRVRKGMARIIRQYCIDCGECIRQCPYDAKKTKRHKLDYVFEKYKYTVALPPPELYSQFNNITDTNIILTGLKKLGFDDVFEVSAAAELVSEATRNFIKENEDKWPLVSTACPSVTRLIRARFPGLVSHLLPIVSPVEVAASIAKQRAVKETGLSPEEIGVVFISSCASRVANIVDTIGMNYSPVDDAVAIKDIYPALVAAMSKLTEDDIEDLTISGKIGVGWGISGGEAKGLFTYEYLAADGIENVINVLEELEDEKLSDRIRFIELNACSGGCVGGTLTVENPYIATSKNHRITKDKEIAIAKIEDYKKEYRLDMSWTIPVEYIPVYQLGDSMIESMTMMSEREEILKELPGLDCGACGAPTCKSLAEDVVRGYAKKEDCIYLMRSEFSELRDEYRELRQRSQLFAETHEDDHKEE